MRAARLTLASLMVLGGVFAARDTSAAITGVIYNGGAGGNGHYYKLYTTSSTWTNAKNAAINVGGYLATVTSAQENSFLYSNNFAANTPWIGATDETVEGTWTWVSGETWSYANWGTGEPNNSGNEDYVTMRTDGYWNDWSSAGTAYYIVEWDTDPNLPADPANLRTTLVSQQQINLAWDDLSTGETGFELEKAVGAAGSFSLLTQPVADAVSYNDSNVTAETLYRYRIRAVNSAGASGYSNTLSVGTAPPPPTGLTASALAARSVQLTWADNSVAETGFEVERGTGSPGANFVAINTAAPNATSYRDDTASPETTYSYRVRAAGAAGKSTYSSEASVTTPLASPSGVGLDAPVDTSVELVWADDSSSETGFEIQRGLGCPAASFTTIATVGANVTTFTDSTVLPQRTYSYRMRTVNAAGASAWSAEKCVTTPPYAPTNAAAQATSANRVHVSWTSNTTIAQTQEIERALGSSGAFVPLTIVGGNVTQYDDATVGQETSYVYRVAAVGTAGRSGWASTAEVDAPAVLIVRKAAIARAKGPAKLTVTGEFDVGGRGVSLAAAASFGVGQESVAVPAFTAAGKGFAYTATGVHAQLTPGKGTSRVAFVLQVDDTLVTMPAPDGLLTISYTNGDFRAVGTVLLGGDGFKPPKLGQYVEPPFNLVSVTAALKDGAKDALSIKAAFRASGAVPGAAPDLHVRFGTYDVRIPAADFTLSGSKWLVREKSLGSRSITFDYAKGTITIVMKGIELGGYPSGPNPVRVTVEFPGAYFDDTPQMASTGKSVKY
jgi:hypothetical protein